MEAHCRQVKSSENPLLCNLWHQALLKQASLCQQVFDTLACQQGWHFKRQQPPAACMLLPVSVFQLFTSSTHPVECALRCGGCRL